MQMKRKKYNQALYNLNCNFRQNKIESRWSDIYPKANVKFWAALKVHYFLVTKECLFMHIKYSPYFSQDFTAASASK